MILSNGFSTKVFHCESDYCLGWNVSYNDDDDDDKNVSIYKSQNIRKYLEHDDKVVTQM